MWGRWLPGVFGQSVSVWGFFGQSVPLGTGKQFATTGRPRPASFRVSPMVSARGVWEMTWTLSGPDGRATFEFVTLYGSPQAMSFQG